MIHDFADSLNKASAEKLYPFWESVYKEMFPNYVSMTGTIDNMPMQRRGIDRIIILSNNRTIFIDEKIRFSNYSDILLEHISVDTNNKPGWIEKENDIDWLAYAFAKKQECFMFPYPALKRVWKYYKKRWIDKYPEIIAKNRDYNTISVAIPTEVLLNKIRDALLIKSSVDIKRQHLVTE